MDEYDQQFNLYNSQVCRLCCVENANGSMLFLSDEDDISFLINTYLPIKVSASSQKFQITSISLMSQSYCGCAVPTAIFVSFIYRSQMMAGCRDGFALDVICRLKRLLSSLTSSLPGSTSCANCLNYSNHQRTSVYSKTMDRLKTQPPLRMLRPKVDAILNHFVMSKFSNNVSS